jgi:PAS domain S-box-containing protein
VKKTKSISHEFSESIIDTIREPLIVLDQDLRVVSASRAFYEFFKVQPEETVGQLIYELGNKQWDIPKLRQLLEEILPQKATFDDYEVEHDFLSIGKHTMLLNARRIPRPPEKTKVILLAIEDITEHKRLENLLTESEERYRRAFETSLDGLLLLDKQTGNIVDNNPAAAKMLGYSGKDLLGKSLKDIGVLKHTMDFKKDLEKMERSELVFYKDVPITTRGGKHIAADIYLIDSATSATSPSVRR